MKYIDRQKYAEELIRQDRYPDALVEYITLFAENPNDLKNIERFTFLFERINDGNYDFDPDTSEQYAMRGTAKFYKKEYGSSILDCDKALSLDSCYHYALRLRALNRKFLGHMEEAIIDLKKAIDIEPTGEYYDDLAEIYQLMGKNNISLKYYQLAIETSPDNPRFWYNYGVELVEDNNIKEALIKFNKAIELWPEYEDAIVNRQYLLNLLE
jgi:tetratricopeptide (TPR) repeat protein